MKDFLARHASKISGVLSGFDRIVFRGYLRSISYAKGFETFLVCQGVLLKDFSRYVRETSERLKTASVASAEKQQRPTKYINSSSLSKENEARRILKKDPVDDGLICVLSCVEPCLTYEIHKSRERKRLELRRSVRKCTHLYHYFLDPKFGFMSARIQTWFPFNIQVCLNGREWLCRQMDRAGLSYRQRDNCLTWIEDITRAQKLLDSQLLTSWPTMLTKFARKLNPAHRSIFRDNHQEYYWCLHQSEWATDVMFGDSRSLAAIYPSLSLHAITRLSSPNVMRFLGQKVHHAFKGEIISDFKDRPEGIRVKHRVRGNSVKMYDKKGSVLRIETTINQPRDLKVFRPKEGDEHGELSWRPLRKGVADIQRRAKLSQDCNDRFLQCLATVEDATPVRELIKESLPSSAHRRQTCPRASTVERPRRRVVTHRESRRIRRHRLPQPRHHGDPPPIKTHAVAHHETQAKRGHDTLAPPPARTSPDPEDSKDAPLSGLRQGPPGDHRDPRGSRRLRGQADARGCRLKFVAA